jgi:hypothetical protein
MSDQTHSFYRMRPLAGVTEFITDKPSVKNTDPFVKVYGKDLTHEETIKLRNWLNSVLPL